MKIKKSFKYRIYPTEEQKVLLSKHFGSKRFVWNHFLDLRKKVYLENKTNLTYYDNSKSLTELKKQEDFVWLKEVNSQSIQYALRDLEVAYTNFFSKKGKFPRFKSKKDKQTFRIPQSTEYKNEQLWIPKFKQTIKVKEDRRQFRRIQRWYTAQQTCQDNYY